MPKLNIDPLADLVPQVSRPKPEPVTGQTGTQVIERKPSGPLLQAFVVVMLMVLAFLVGAKYFGSGGGDDHKQDDHHEQKQDDKKQDDKKQDGKNVAVKPGKLFVIRERKFPTIDENFMAESVQAFAAKHKDSSLTFGGEFDDNDPTKEVLALKEQAGVKGVKPPCVIFEAEGKSSYGAIPLTGDESKLMEVFK